MPIKMTYGIVIKVWWSYTWRAIILGWAMFLVVGIILATSGLLPRTTPRPPPTPETLRHQLRALAIVWPIFIVVGSAMGVFAMRWTLATRWSNFRLEAISERDS
jgi:hypothetical protein